MLLPFTCDLFLSSFLGAKGAELWNTEEIIEKNTYRMEMTLVFDYICGSNLVPFTFLHHKGNVLAATSYFWPKMRECITNSWIPFRLPIRSLCQ